MTAPPTPGFQKGISLVMVMVVLTLASLLVVGSARLDLLNERLVSNQSDHGRAWAAAEALLRDAENDIQGTRADGTPCSTEPSERGCRGALAANHPFFPTSPDDLALLANRIGDGQVCRAGICLPRTLTSLNPQAFAALLVQETATPTASVARGAVYGQYTGTTTRHPLLSGPSARAWYWVEVFQYEMDNPVVTPGWNPPVPDASHPFVYRINAYAQGHRSGTRVWLRALFVPKRQDSTQ